jgi:hypothetical protein
MLIKLDSNLALFSDKTPPDVAFSSLTDNLKALTSIVDPYPTYGIRSKTKFDP